jgi:hypothetical protein
MIVLKERKYLKKELSRKWKINIMANIKHEEYNLCGKIYLVEIGYQFGRSDQDDINDKKKEIERLKKDNNWCDSNCDNRERERESKSTLTHLAFN